MTLLLRAVAGSRLYGTYREDSDWDWYEVYDHIRAKQTIRAGQDVTRMPLSQWILLAEKGTHQALDAMWAPPEYTEVDLLQDFRLHFRPDPWRAADQLGRTARAFTNVDRSLKHIDRLLWCEHRVRQFGYYDPTEWGRRVQNDRNATNS